MLPAVLLLSRTGVPTLVFEQVSLFSVVKENVLCAFIHTSVVEDARYALKQLLGTDPVIAVADLSPPDRVMGTSTTLLNQPGFGRLLQDTDTLLLSAATLAESPTLIDTLDEAFWTISEKVNTMLKSLIGTTVVAGHAVGAASWAYAWVVQNALSKINRNMLEVTKLNVCAEQPRN